MKINVIAATFFAAATLIFGSAKAFAHAVPCDIIWGSTDSNSRSCANNQASIITYSIGRSGLFWDNFEEECYGSEAEARKALIHAQNIGVCETSPNQREAHSCDILWGTTDSNGRSCGSNQASVIVYLPATRGGLFWDTYKEECYGSEAEARRAMAHAEQIGVCKMTTRKTAASAVIPDVNKQVANHVKPDHSNHDDVISAPGPKKPEGNGPTVKPDAPSNQGGITIL